MHDLNNGWVFGSPTTEENEKEKEKGRRPKSNTPLLMKKKKKRGLRLHRVIFNLALNRTFRV